MVPDCTVPHCTGVDGLDAHPANWPPLDPDSRRESKPVLNLSIQSRCPQTNALPDFLSHHARHFGNSDIFIWLSSFHPGPDKNLPLVLCASFTNAQSASTFALQHRPDLHQTPTVSDLERRPPESRLAQTHHGTVSESAAGGTVSVYVCVSPALSLWVLC